MNKILKYVGLGLLILLIVLVAVSFALPRTYYVERSTYINAPSAVVYPYLNDLKRWSEWTVWTKEKFPDMVQTFPEKTEGEGASYSWTGKSSGNGRIKIVKSDPATGIAYDLDFEQGKYLSKGEIRLKDPRRSHNSKGTHFTDEGVHVTWTNEGELGMNPINRYIGLLMDYFMGPDFEKGLQNLKDKAEKR